ncbi:hypothetical protein ACOSQ2_019573 [Xanthoceras sorbifolium]
MESALLCNVSMIAVTDMCSDSSDISLVDEVENEEHMVRTMAKYCHENQWTPNPNGSIDFKEGQIFGNAKLVRKVVKQYAIQEGFMLTKIKNDRTRFHASCLPDGLTFMIRSVREGHSLCLKTTSNKEANFKWLLEVVGTAIMANPTILPKVLKTELQEKYAIKCDSQTIYRDKKRVLKNLKAGHVNSYAKIRQYANVVHLMNQGTVAKVMVDHSFGHIIANFRATLKNLNMIGKLWVASRVGNASGFKEVMESINDDNVHWYYSKEAMKLTYSDNINPVPEEAL